MVELKITKDRGVTLIELMIVMVIAAILVGGIYSLFMTQQRSYAVQDQVAGVQQDARAALDILARDIRMAGSLTENVGFTVNTYTFAITPDNGGGSTPASNPDVITVVSAAEAFTSGGIPVMVTNVDVNNKTVALSAIADPTVFNTGTRSYVAFEGVNHVYQISAGIGTKILTLTESAPSYLDNVGAKVFLVKAITYLVTTADGVLRRDENTGNGAQPLAGDGVTTLVEDLQFTYQVAGSNDWIFDAGAAAWPAGSSNADIKMVRISLIVRTVIPDPKETGFSRPDCEDRTGDTTNPGCRRRVYTTVVKVRNL